MHLQRKELNYSGENIYVGIDVHKRSWRIALLTDTLELKGFSMPSDPDGLITYLHRHYPGAIYYSVYEAGFCGVWIHNHLIANGVNNIIVNPADVPSTNKERERKTDAVDATKLAHSLRWGELTGIYIHQQKSLHDRSLMRLRISEVNHMTVLKNQIKGMLHFYGVKIPLELESSSKSWSGGLIRWLTQEVLSQGVVAQAALGFMLDEYHSKRKRMTEILYQIRLLSKTPAYRSNMEWIGKVPGIGLKSGMHLLVNIEDINRFANRDKFAGYMGFVPSSHSTGEKESSGRITSRAPRELRGILIECAWVAVRSDPCLTLKYSQLRKRMDENKAIVRIARKLCNRIYYVLKYKREYVNGVVQ